MGKTAKIKTTVTTENVTDFVNRIEDVGRKKDTETLIKLMTNASKNEPKLWVSGIIAFGEMIYTSPATGREVQWFKIGFSPRKTNFSLYLNINLQKHVELLQQLGKYKTGAGCIYINKLSDIDIKVLKKLISIAIIEKK